MIKGRHALTLPPLAGASMIPLPGYLFIIFIESVLIIIICSTLIMNQSCFDYELDILILLYFFVVLFVK